MPKTLGINLTFAKAATPAKAAEWNEWYDTTHLDDILSTGAFSHCSRWEVVQDNPLSMPRLGFSHVNMSRIAQADVNGALSKVNAAAPGWRAAGHMNKYHFVDDVIPMKLLGKSPELFVPNPKTTALFMIFNRCNDPSKMAEWHHWLEDEHLPECMEVGKFANYTRWERTQPMPHGPNYFVMWEIQDEDIHAGNRRVIQLNVDWEKRGHIPAFHAGALMFLARPTGKWGAMGRLAKGVSL